MKIDLSGKRAVVTGSTDGIGAAIASGLAAAGAAVVINGRTPEKVAAAVAAIAGAGDGARLEGLAGDLSTAAGCAAFVRACPATDILVNNLGVYEPKPFADIADEDWTRFFETNVMSGVRLSRAYLPGMRAKNWGRVVFISSESGINIPDDMLHYGVTKAAQLAISRGLAKSLRGTNVTVNAILPGPTLSRGVGGWMEAAAAKSGKTVEEVSTAFVREKRGTSIISRMAAVEEVANMVVYACSPQASATTGAALRVEGGIVETPF